MNPAILETLDMPRLGTELQRARKRKGLTQADAAEAIGVKRTTMVAIEQGQRRVTIDELIALARLYERPLHDLVRPRPDFSSIGVQFRGPTWRTAEDDVAVAPFIQEFEDLCRGYWELEQKLGTPLMKKYPQERDVAGEPIEETAEGIAIEERERLGLSDRPLPALRQLLENDVGLRIFSLPLASGFSELYTYTDDVGGCLAIHQHHPETRRRWSLAHGYFHFLAHRRDAIMTREGERSASEAERNKERFADAFARYFLMPTAGITRRFNDLKRAGTVTPTVLSNLAFYYGVSPEALVRRLEGLHLLPTNMWERIKHLDWGTLQTYLGLVPDDRDDERLPVRFRMLAMAALQEGSITDAEFARILEVDRVTAREWQARLRTPEPPAGSDAGE